MRARGRASHVEHFEKAKDRDGRCYKAGLESMAKGQTWLSTSFVIKFYWNIAALIHLCCFYTTVAELNNCNRDHMACKA